MRTGDALEKVRRTRPAWFRPYGERLLREVGHRAAVGSWHAAQRKSVSKRASKRLADLVK